MLFEKLVIEHMRSTTKPVTISTGIAFGHKMMDIGSYRFIELDDTTVAVEADKFTAKCTDWEQLEFIWKAVR